MLCRYQNYSHLLSKMGDSQTVEVRTYSNRFRLLGIRLPHPCSCKDAKAAIAKKLGVKPQSLPLFGLFIGPQGRPNKVLMGAEAVPLGAELSLGRWSFDAEREAKLCRQDDVAMHLLYCEAKFQYHHETKLSPTPQQEEELEGLMDPDFPVERQSMEVMREVRGYWTYIVHECSVKSDIVCNTCTLPKGTQIICSLDMERFAFLSTKFELLIDWPWRVVRRWKMDRGNTIMFEVCLDEQNAGILRWLSLETRQSNFLFHLAGEICDRAKEVKDKEDPLPAPNPALAGKVQDPLAEFVNGLFFGSKPKFSSIDS